MIRPSTMLGTESSKELEKFDPVLWVGNLDPRGVSRPRRPGFPRGILNSLALVKE